MTRLQDSHQKALRPARLLPPKRLLTPRSARHLSATNRGLLPGAPTPTRTGLPPAGVIQLRGRNTASRLIPRSENPTLNSRGRTRAAILRGLFERANHAGAFSRSIRSIRGPADHSRVP